MVSTIHRDQQPCAVHRETDWLGRPDRRCRGPNDDTSVSLVDFGKAGLAISLSVNGFHRVSVACPVAQLFSSLAC
jgi:hypothetical protein